MRWFSAHIIMYFDPQNPDDPPVDVPGREFVVWENIVLFQGSTVGEVFAKANERGRSDERDQGGGMILEDRPVKMVFGGVRNVVECDLSGSGGSLKEGAEITYQEIKIRGADGLEKYIKGEPVDATLC